MGRRLILEPWARNIWTLIHITKNISCGNHGIIITFVKLNDKVKKGEEIGLIKFGSRVDIIVPKLDNMKILVKKNSYIKGGDPLITYI